MRVPSDMPRPRRERIGNRGRIGLVLLAVALFIILTSLRGIAGFYTDLLWFDSLGYRGVFTGVLGAKMKVLRGPNSSSIVAAPAPLAVVA